MKKVAFFAVVLTVLASLALTGCEQKSDAEKALDQMKEDVNSMAK